MEESKPTQNPIQIPPPETAPVPPSEQPPPPPPPAADVAQPPAESQLPPSAKAAAQPASATAAMPPPPPPAPAAIPPPPTPAAVAPPPKSKKRPLEGNVQIQDCSYFKMRAVLKDVRPHLLEVVRTLDFRNCKAAAEVRERLKQLMQLYKQLTAEAVTNKKSKIALEGQKLSNENEAGQKPREQLQDVKPADQPPKDCTSAKPSEEQSCYIGGSAFGWNFITYGGTNPVYYGRTKESFRAAQAAS